MKKFCMLIFVFVIQFCFSQNKIDLLNSEDEVQNFVRSAISSDSLLKKFKLTAIKEFNNETVNDRIRKIADSLHIDKSFYKGDFDHNGLTDLLFIGDDGGCTGFKDQNSWSCDYSTLVLLDLGNQFLLKSIQQNHNSKAVPVIRKIENQDYLEVVMEKQNGFFSDDQSIISKILTYEFDNFIEYNPKIQKHTIEKIVFETSGCFGSCPVFRLELNKNKPSKFIATAYNFSDDESKVNFKKGEGKFETIIKESDFQNIETILNSIDFSNLENNYSVNWTDDQTSNIFITYDNGKTKKIQDYGMVGTYGLKKIYKTLFDLRFNQNWKKVK